MPLPPPPPPLKCNIAPFINIFTAGERVVTASQVSEDWHCELNAVGYQESKGKL